MTSRFSRRQFFRRTGCAAMSSLPVLNTMLNLKLAGNLAAASAPADGEYRALVCLFFAGGIDSFNVLVPRSNAEYNEYQTVRGNLALAQNVLLPLNPTVSPGLDLGLHPALPGLQNIFNNAGAGGVGGAAFVANVGTLLEPVTPDQFNNGVGRYPLGLFSHSDQIEQWQTGTSDIRSSRGWGGRAADVLIGGAKQNVSMNLSLSGGNVWQSGEEVFAYTVGTDGATPLYGYDPSDNDPTDITAIRTRAVDRQLTLAYQHLLTEEFADRKRSAIDTYQLFNSATDNVTLPANIDFNENNSYLGAQLQMVAKTIKAHADLGHTRQTFYVEIDGWDMHSRLIAGQAELLPPVDAAITAFYNCLKAMSLDSHVTTFSASDFARTLSSNGDGTDHAWGGNHFVFGGAVQGQKIYGTYPGLVEDGPLDVGRGRFIPTTAVDLYFAELALWLGVPKSSLATVLPNVGQFYNTGGTGSPMGFLS